MNKYKPEKVTSPGLTIYDWLKEKNIGVYKFAGIVKMNVNEIYNILAGIGIIDIEIAKKLELGTGISKDFWLKREKNYRDSL